ncbi:hypothetical protein BDV26DRAFT_282973 [Aspergillus bertholletiae]|uniref:Uncharacterized protein n=1 Tax=Aspergillus bertholletiae TaxID=1226010 RepID=A0A5N7B1X3_9EURO|nr:hypothetical protein BDV26DRAFT_282973 [Aspergillus bertholletiae]
MLFSSVRNVELLVLGALIAFGPLPGFSLDIRKEKDPLGPLNVTLDYGLATTWPTQQNVNQKVAKLNWQFSSHIVFAGRVGNSDENDPPISDGQLWKIAEDAHQEMIRDAEQYGILLNQVPRAMTILAWGNETILASSMKGASSFSYGFLNGDTPVGRSLQQCQIVWRDTSSPTADKTRTHKNGGNYAEPMAAHLYYKNNGIDLQDKRARIGTWVTGDKECRHGCSFLKAFFTANQGLRLLDKNTPLESCTLANLAGGPITQDQIQLCGAPP